MPHHSLPCASTLKAQDALKKIDDHLRRTGGRMTDVRREIVLKMAELGSPHTAYQILEAANKNRKRKLSPISLYRTLDFLIEAGVALKLESKNVFELCHKDELSHSHLVMVCDHCGLMREIEDHELAKAIAQKARKYRHILKHHAIEIHGLCKTC
ncbi:MAG: transcriptional repressor [Bdellovibrionales bacterium]